MCKTTIDLISVQLGNDIQFVRVYTGLNFLIGMRASGKTLTLKEVEDYYIKKSITVSAYYGDSLEKDKIEYLEAISTIGDLNEEDITKRYPLTISEVRNYKISTCLNIEADVYILDCPENDFSNGNIINSLVPKIRRLVDKNKKIIISTHSSSLFHSTKPQSIIYTKIERNNRDITIFQGNSSDQYISNKNGETLDIEEIKQLLFDGYSGNASIDIDDYPSILEYYGVKKIYQKIGKPRVSKEVSKRNSLYDLGTESNFVIQSKYINQLIQLGVKVDSLDENTLRFYSTGSLIYDCLNVINSDYFDYGPCVLSWSRAIENELFVKFRRMILTDEEFKKNAIYNKEKDELKFSLGSLPLLFRTREISNENVFVEKYSRLSYSNDILRQLYHVLVKIDQLNKNYRVASAHKKRIEYKKASYCKELLEESPIILGFLSGIS